MKESRWNVYYFKKGNNIYTYESIDKLKNISYDKNCRFMIANTLTRCAIELDECNFNILKNRSYNFSCDDANILMEQGVFVDDHYNELDHLDKLRKYHIFDDSVSNLIICPTLDCNFNCSYCYEQKEKGFMSILVQNKLLQFYEQLLKSGLKSVTITWYGGEPLLYPYIIQNLSKKLSSLAKKFKSNISFSIISNGYCISPKIVKLFKELNLETIQITLDGLADTHNLRRSLKDGSKTFDVILKNIIILSEAGIKVKVRVNLDKSNIDQFDKVRRLLPDNVIVYPALVTKESTQSSEIQNQCLKCSDFLNVFADNRLLMPRTYGQLNSISVICSGEHIKSFVIAPTGEVYKCINDIGIKRMSIGSLFDTDNLSNSKNYKAYIERDPFKEKECANCSYIPLCYGACFNEFLKNGKHSCVPNRYYFDEISKQFLI